MNSFAHSLRHRLMLSVSLAGGALLAGYGRAIAGTCTVQGGAYVCSGPAAPATDQPQTITGAATTSAGFGIDTRTHGGNAFNLNGPATFTDANASLIAGGDTAIRGYTPTGALTVTTSGSVIGRTYDGIYLSAASGSVGDLTVSESGTVTAGRDAVFVNNTGAGGVSITTGGLVTATGTHSGNAAIVGADGPLGTGVTISTGAVTGAYVGISARSQGLGSVSVTTTGALNTAGDAIQATSSNALASNLVVSSSGLIAAGSNGVVVRNSGSGDTTVQATAAITATTGDGVSANSGVGGAGIGSNIQVATAAVTAGATGISVDNNGVGATTITTNGPIVATTYNGISATAEPTTTGGISITAGGAITAGGDGISANNNGLGAITIAAPSQITAYGSHSGDAAITARGGGSATGITITAGAITDTANTGINAQNYGPGSVSVSVVGPLSANGAGIFAFERSAVGGNVTVSTQSTVNSAGVGISANNSGAGYTLVTASGPIVTTAGDGIDANVGNGDSGVGTNLTVNAGAISAQASAISVDNNGVGTTTITTTGAIVA